TRPWIEQDAHGSCDGFALRKGQRAIQTIEYRGWRVAVQSIRPQYIADLPHHGGGPQTMAHDVPHGHRHLAVGEGHGIEPVAAYLQRLTAWKVPRRDLQTFDLWHLLGQEAPLQRLGDPVFLLVDLRLVDGERRPGGDQLQQPDLVRAEPAAEVRADVEDAEHLPLL